MAVNPGWAVGVDQYGRRYQYNQATGESKWLEAPLPVTVVDHGRIDSDSDEDDGTNTDGTWSHNVRRKRTHHKYVSRAQNDARMKAVQDDYSQLADELTGGLVSGMKSLFKSKTRPQLVSSYHSYYGAPAMHGLASAASTPSLQHLNTMPNMPSAKALEAVTSSVLVSPVATPSAAKTKKEPRAQRDNWRDKKAAVAVGGPIDEADALEQELKDRARSTSGMKVPTPAATAAAASVNPDVMMQQELLALQERVHKERVQALVKSYKKLTRAPERKAFLSELTAEQIKMLYDNVPEFVRKVLLAELTPAQKAALERDLAADTGDHAAEAYPQSAVDGGDALDSQVAATTQQCVYDEHGYEYAQVQLDEYGGYYDHNHDYYMYNAETGQYQKYDWQAGRFIDPSYDYAAYGYDQQQQQQQQQQQYHYGADGSYYGGEHNYAADGSWQDNSDQAYHYGYDASWAAANGQMSSEEYSALVNEVASSNASIQSDALAESQAAEAVSAAIAQLEEAETAVTTIEAEVQQIKQQLAIPDTDVLDQIKAEAAADTEALLASRDQERARQRAALQARLDAANAKKEHAARVAAEMAAAAEAAKKAAAEQAEAARARRAAILAEAEAKIKKEGFDVEAQLRKVREQHEEDLTSLVKGRDRERRRQTASLQQKLEARNHRRRLQAAQAKATVDPMSPAPLIISPVTSPRGAAEPSGSPEKRGPRGRLLVRTGSKREVGGAPSPIPALIPPPADSIESLLQKPLAAATDLSPTKPVRPRPSLLVAANSTAPSHSPPTITPREPIPSEVSPMQQPPMSARRRSGLLLDPLPAKRASAVESMAPSLTGADASPGISSGLKASPIGGGDSLDTFLHAR